MKWVAFANLRALEMEAQLEPGDATAGFSARPEHRENTYKRLRRLGWPKEDVAQFMIEMERHEGFIDLGLAGG
jgi:hypothetical protein